MCLQLLWNSQILLSHFKLAWQSFLWQNKYIITVKHFKTFRELGWCLYFLRFSLKLKKVIKPPTRILWNWLFRRWKVFNARSSSTFVFFLYPTLLIKQKTPFTPTCTDSVEPFYSRLANHFSHFSADNTFCTFDPHSHIRTATMVPYRRIASGKLFIRLRTPHFYRVIAKNPIDLV